MDRPKRGQARYFIKERTAASDRTPGEAQARMLLGAAPEEGRTVLLARRGTDGPLLGAVSTPDLDGRTNILLVDEDGKRLTLPEGPPPRCTPCRAALKESPVVSRSAQLVADVGLDAEVIFILEETDDG